MRKESEPKRQPKHSAADELLHDKETASAQPETAQTRAESERLVLLEQPDQLISHVNTLRDDGDFRGAADFLRQALHQDPGNSEIGYLLAKTQLQLRRQEEKRARESLVSEARARFEEHVGRGELFEAEAVLTQIGFLPGAIEELKDLRVRLAAIRREREQVELASILREAQRLRDADRLQESVEEARQALALDPQNREATILVDTLILEIADREREAAVRQDGDRIDALLHRGRLLRAELSIRRSWRRYGELQAFRDQHQRCRRLRTLRWAKRFAKVEELGRTIPIDRIRTYPSSAVRTGTHTMSRGWDHASHAAGALSEWIRLRIEDWSKARARVLIAAACLAVLATAGVYLANARSQREPEAADLVDVPIDGQISVLDPDLEGTVAYSGSLILDALPWGRVVAIVSEEGEQQDLGESLFTPVRLSLPAGSYRVVLENPAVEEPAEFWVQVTPAEVRTKVHTFEPFDADSYFDKAW